MAKRLTKITTKTGDDGHTGLASGRRVPKHDDLIAAIGEVDECNSAIGLILAEPDIDTEIHTLLTQVQQHLFYIGADLACEGSAYLHDEHVQWMEAHITSYNDSLPDLEEFILPQGCRAAACCHLARAIARRAERQLVILAELPKPIAQYINRLSDLLFILARLLNRNAGVDAVSVQF